MVRSNGDGRDAACRGRQRSRRSDRLAGRCSSGIDRFVARSRIAHPGGARAHAARRARGAPQRVAALASNGARAPVVDRSAGALGARPSQSVRVADAADRRDCRGLPRSVPSGSRQRRRPVSAHRKKLEQRARHVPRRAASSVERICAPDAGARRVLIARWTAQARLLRPRFRVAAPGAQQLLRRLAPSRPRRSTAPRHSRTRGPVRA